MSEPRFTRGPWAIESQDWGDGRNPTGITAHHDVGVIRSDEGFAFWHQDQPDSDVAWANAHLVAAAPELYAALVDAAKELADANYSDEFYEALVKAQTALAKARGEAGSE